MCLTTEGPCLIHSMNGDLLRTLEGPDGCVRPRLVQSSTEGHCVIYYDKGHFCVFSINGKLLGHMEVEDNIKVNMSINSPLYNYLGIGSKGKGLAALAYPFVPPFLDLFSFIFSDSVFYHVSCLECD